MFRSGLIQMLNRHLWLQYIIVIFPIFMVMVYGYAYMTDMLGIARSLAYNDQISSRAWDTGELREVTYSDTDEDNVFHAVVSGDSTAVVKGGVDDVLFYVQIYGVDWYQLVTAGGDYMMLEQCDLFDVEDVGDGVVRVTHDDISLDFEYGDIVASVCVSPDELWRVYFVVEDLPYYDLEELHMVELLSVEDGLYEVQVQGSYELEIDDIELNFCTNLPTDSVYYNETTGSFVKNVDKDYPWTFILRSNIVIVLLSTAFLSLLLYKMQEERKLSILENKGVLRATVFAGCLLACCVPFTLIML